MENKVLEAMHAGISYYNSYQHAPNDLQKKAKQLCWEYNQSRPDEVEKRRKILKDLFGKYNEMVMIEPAFHCDYGFNIYFQGMALLNYNVTILDDAKVLIGANAFIAPGTVLSCASHAIDAEQRNEGVSQNDPITLEDDVWIGANCTICGGVTIGKGSVIGAGSVVTKDIPSGVVAVGSPCRVMRKITEKDKIDINKIL